MTVIKEGLERNMIGEARLGYIGSMYMVKRSGCTVLLLGRLLCLLIAVVGCDGTVRPPDSERHWRELQGNVEDGLLLSVWGANAQDVWVVGGRPGKTLVLRGNQARLQEITNPGAAMAWWVCGLGDRVAVVGEEGLLMTQTDTGEFEVMDVGIESTLYGCWGSSVDDFWVVGGDPLNGPAELAHVKNGQAIAPDLGPLVSELPRVLFKMIGIDGNLLIVGGDGSLLRRNVQGDWELSRIAHPSIPLFTISGLSAEDVWAVGGLGTAVAVHFDGAQWQDASPQLLPNLFGVSALHDEVVVVGSSGALAERRGGDWSVIDTFSEDTFHGAWLDGEGGGWAVGGNVLEQDPALRYGFIWVR